jgi:hypothetical protein
MKAIFQAGSLVILALGLGTAGASAQTDAGGRHFVRERGVLAPMERPTYGAANRWHGPQRFGRSRYTPRAYVYGRRLPEYAPRPAYDIPADGRRLAYRAGDRRGRVAAYSWRRPAYSYAPRFSYYRPRVRYAYAETPLAYDLPRATYATGIFSTNAAVGLHTYDYAYTTQLRPIAAYGGATGSYAGGYPIYNRPLAPAYPTPRCDCD